MAISRALVCVKQWETTELSVIRSSGDIGQFNKCIVCACFVLVPSSRDNSPTRVAAALIPSS